MAYEKTETSIQQIESQREIEISKRMFTQFIYQGEYENETTRNEFLNNWSKHVKEILGTSSGIYEFITSHRIIIPFEHQE
ncbi:MAG: hypothetical protein COA31_006910 [Flavobacteriales bacterium]|nr:hypothetical protein [Flavobacteriales bacterium]